MKKFFLLLISIFSIFAIYKYTNAESNGIPLRDHAFKSVVPELLQIKINDTIHDIILLPEGEIDQKEASSIIHSINKLPPSLLTKIKNDRIHIQLFTGNLTDHPTTNHLKGVIPRGYTSGITWDDVPGIGGGHTVLIKIGHSGKGKGHGSVNLELHELAHSIDKIVFNGIRGNKIFLDIWQREKYQLFPDQTYFTVFPEEYFAESFAYFYYDDNHHSLLNEKAKETYEFIKNLR